MLSKCYKLKVVAEDKSNTWTLPEIEVTHDLEEVPVPVGTIAKDKTEAHTGYYVFLKRCKNCHQLFWEKAHED